jgi:hypothetical protein
MWLTAGAELCAFERMLQFVRMEAERTWLALVDDTAIAIDEVKSIRPSGVGLFGDILESIDHGRELDAEFANTAVGDLSALIEAARTGEHNLILHVALHLPDVAWVRFEDVNGVEGNVVSIFLV